MPDPVIANARSSRYLTVVEFTRKTLNLLSCLLVHVKMGFECIASSFESDSMLSYNS